MQIFVDTSDPAVIKDLYDRGVVNGVTTNPTTASKYIRENGREIKNIRDLARAIYNSVGAIPVSIETVGCGPPDYNWRDMTDVDCKKWAQFEDRIYSEAEMIIKWNEELRANFWQKVPVIPAGVRAIGRLVGDYGDKAKINATLGFDYHQGVRAAEAGAYVFSLFMGRMDATGENSLEVARKIIKEYRDREFRTGFLAASMRTPELILASWKAGADIVTAPPEVLDELIKKYPSDLEAMKKQHPDRERMLVSRLVPVAYFNYEFRHPLLQPGVERFVSDAQSAQYNLLA